MGMHAVGSGGEQVARLLGLLGRLGVPFDYERSFRVCDGGVYPDRFLLSGCKRDLGAGADKKVLGVCHQLGMPREQLDTVGFHLPATQNVHFGYEEGTGGCLYKVYLELAEGVRLIMSPDGGSEPVLLYLAYKWDAAGGGRGAVTRYTWYPMREVGEVFGKVVEAFGGDAAGEPYQVTRAFVELAASRMPVEDVQYLEVVEDATGRRSFDINFYDAELVVADVQPLLVRICRHYGVGMGRFQELYDRIKSMRVGHLSGGVHRDGRGFFTVYYGACVGDGLPQAVDDAGLERGVA